MEWKICLKKVQDKKDNYKTKLNVDLVKKKRWHEADEPLFFSFSCVTKKSEQ